MKLLNYTSSWFAIILFVILTVWATIFYFNMLDEIYDSIDDGLENQKILVIRKAQQDSTVLQRHRFDDGYYKIRQLPFQQVENYRDTYVDTLMYTLNEEDFEPFRMLKTAFQQNGEYYELRVITSMVEEDDLVEDLLFGLIFLYVGLMACIIVLNNFLLKKIWTPFYQLLGRLKRFRLDDPKPFEAPETTIYEFHLLIKSIQRLLRSNIQIYTSQKQFIENASHELQTPLAICLNKLELLVEGDALNAEELSIISSVIGNLESLSRLNKSLLLLSKISNNQFSDEQEINFNQLLHEAVDNFSDLSGHRNIAVSLKEEGTCLHKMNPDLAQVMITNLLKNALVHNHSGGTVNILLTQSALTIENTGKEAPLDSDTLFERFMKGHTSQSSNGLGLSIVKAITDLYGFSIHYAYRRKHSITLSFGNHKLTTSR